MGINWEPNERTVDFLVELISKMMGLGALAFPFQM